MCSVLETPPSRCFLPSLPALIQGSSLEELEDNSSHIEPPQPFSVLARAWLTVQLEKQAEAGTKESLTGVQLSNSFPCTKCRPQPYALEPNGNGQNSCFAQGVFIYSQSGVFQGTPALLTQVTGALDGYGEPREPRASGEETPSVGELLGHVGQREGSVRILLHSCSNSASKEEGNGAGSRWTHSSFLWATTASSVASPQLRSAFTSRLASLPVTLRMSLSWSCLCPLAHSVRMSFRKHYSLTGNKGKLERLGNVSPGRCTASN